MGAGLLLTALLFGLRHGIDWDHIAAITDISGSQTNPRRSMVLATAYALGHAVVVLLLGALAVIAGEELPRGVDAVMERLVGVTLLALGVYLVYSLIRHGAAFRMKSRWMLLIAAARGAARWLGHGARRTYEIVHEHDHSVEGHGHEHVHEYAGATRVDGLSAAARHRAKGARLRERHTHVHRHVGTLPADPFAGYGGLTSFSVGMLHGVGVETPTQVLLFLATAGVAGSAGGLAMLGAFVGGLLVSNSLVAVAATFGFTGASRAWPVYVALGSVTAIFSLVVGGLFLAGKGQLLPGFFTG